MEPTSNFWNVTLAQIVTWLLVVGAGSLSIYVSVKLLGQRMDGFEDWRAAHEKESGERDTFLRKLEVATEKLTLLADLAGKRLERLEERRQFPRQP
jgi:hypothetical protein